MLILTYLRILSQKSSIDSDQQYFGANQITTFPQLAKSTKKMEKSTSQEGYPAIKSSHARPFISILHCNLTILGSHLKRCSTKAGGS